MKESLRDRDFDLAGVKEPDPESSVTTYVRAKDLGPGEVRDYARQIASGLLVSADTPIGDLLVALKGKEQFFVLGGTGILGIVTRADLNKPPVRAYLFGLISLLEMHLDFWVGRFYAEEDVERTLSPNRLVEAKSVQKQKRSRNAGTELMRCLQFCDKRELLSREQQFLDSVGLRKGGFRKLITSAEALRNDLAHSEPNLAAGSSWEKLIASVEEIASFLHNSDNVAEQPREATRDYTDLLVFADD